jgi:HEAT repeat protein
MKAIDLAILCAFSPALAAQPAPKLADMEPVLDRIAAWDPGQARDPLYDFTNFLRAAIHAQSELPQIEARLLRMFDTRAKTSPAGKDFVCRQLSMIGTAASVPTLARLLNDISMAEIARYTLERIPGPAAGAALRKALPRASGKAQAGIINALGERRDAKATPELQNLLAASEADISEAALTALARIGDSRALAAIGGALEKAPAGRRESVLRAYVRCADAVAASGDKVSARTVYRRLSASTEPAMIRIAALHGLAAVDGKAAAPVLVKELASTNPDVQAAVISLLSRMPGSDIAALFGKQYTGLTPIGQIRVLTALAEQGDAAVARPLATQALQSVVPELRTTALRVIGKVGDGSSVPLLAGRAANSQGAEQEAARESLGLVVGTGVDAAIVSGMSTSSGKEHLELIRAAGERASPQFANTLMKIAQGPEREPAQAAIRALRNAAGPEQAPALLASVLKIQNANDRREAAMTLASVIKRAAKPALAPVLAAYHAAPDKQTRLTLIDVMGQVSAADALPDLRAALKDPDQEIARSAILALSAWQTPEPLPDLLDVARNDSNPTRRILALRGYTKVIAAPSDRSPAESVSLLKQLWPFARQQPEKRAILALLPLYPTAEALQFAATAAADPEVASEAKAAADNIRAFGVQ